MMKFQTKYLKNFEKRVRIFFCNIQSKRLLNKEGILCHIKQSNAEGPVDFINAYDLEAMAQQVIPKTAFGYIASGAEDTFTLRENIRAFNHKLIVPHTLCDVENPSTEIEFAGEKLSSPIIMAPVAAHKLANEQGEVATARGVHEFGSLYTTSSYSTVDLPEITEALQGTPHWFQFYFSKDDGINRHIMDRLKAEGYKSDCLDSRCDCRGNREVDKRNGFVFQLACRLLKNTCQKVLENQWTLFTNQPNNACLHVM